MTFILNKKMVVAIAVSVLFMGTFIAIANASHSWGKYHWDISTAESEVSPLILGNNLTSAKWHDSLLGTPSSTGAAFDWNLSVLKNQVVTGTNTACDPVLGQVEVCNASYGTNGWLGIAQIWAYRGKDGHIAQGLVKLNDTYFDLPAYDAPLWRDLAMCQEIGHTLGLGHVDEDFNNASQGTCMDYSANPTDVDRHPNQHDYDMLTEIYGHLNEVEEPKGGNGGGNGKGGGKGKPSEVGNGANLNNPSAWGDIVKRDAQGKASVYVRNLGNGVEVFTFVTWVDHTHNH